MLMVVQYIYSVYLGRRCGIFYLELLKVYTKDTKPTDRDSYEYKRLDLQDTLINDIFKE